MKQACDTFTQDMFPTPATKPRYRFYVKGHDGLTTEWTGLTKKQARDMYSYTNAHQPSNVVAMGWEELQ